MGISGVAFAPSWAVTLFFSLPFVLLFLAILSSSGSVVISWPQLALLQLIFVYGQLAWAWSLLQHTSTRSGVEFRWARSVFIATAIAFPALALLGFIFPELILNADLRNERGGIEAAAIDAMVLLCVVGFLSCHWYATKSLVNAEARRGYPPADELLTFVTMLYLIIGVWFLRPRLLLVA